jgi:RNA recognition motif-containing protein
MRQDKFRGNVFVANLPNGYTDEQLAQLFDPFGIVLSAFLARDLVTRAIKGFGLVNVAPDRAASEAIAALNGMRIGDRCIEVRQADPTMSINIPTARPASRPASARPRELPPRPAPRRPVIVEYRTSQRRP